MNRTIRSYSASGRSTVTVELPNSASPIARVVHAVARAVIAPAVDAVATAQARGILGGPRILRVVNQLEALAWPVALVWPLRPVRGTRRKSVHIPAYAEDDKHLAAEWVWYRETPDSRTFRGSAVLYFHGGGFVTCGLRTHRRIVSRIARESGVPVLNVDYRLAPDTHPSGAAEDGLRAYRWLIDMGWPAERIIFGGDSAGGGLAFMVALRARAEGLPMPGGMVALSPAADFDCTARYTHPNADLEPILRPRLTEELVKRAIMIDGRLDPDWSPVNHEFHDMPPALIMVGSTEVLLADAEQLADRYAAAGVPCRLQLWDRQLHVFPAGADVLPEGRAAFRYIGEFIRQTLDSPASGRRVA